MYRTRPSWPGYGISGWICASCRHQKTSHRWMSRGTANAPTAAASQGRRKAIVAAAAGVAAGAAIFTFRDELWFAGLAVQRSGRVLITLAQCMNDYRVVMNGQDGGSAGGYEAALKACHQRCADRTLATMQKNGSIFIKLGQHLSSMQYLLPREWCETFVPLQDNCPVSSFASVAGLIEGETGLALAEYFSYFNPAPIGAASLAQVHEAVVRSSGQTVAVKVQHAFLADWARLDMALARLTFAALRRFFPAYDLTWLADEMAASLPQELDFEREAGNAARLRAHFAGVADVPLVVPRVLWARPRVLVMDYVADRHRVDDLAYLTAHGIDRDAVAAALARLFNEMIFRPGAPLHCDPHGGNIAIRHNPARPGPDKFDIILFDHGLYRDIPDQLRLHYARLWLAVLDADEPAMRRYARAVAGIADRDFPLFASAITGRNYGIGSAAAPATLLAQPSKPPAGPAEPEPIKDALNQSLLVQLMHLLGQVPPIILLILKTNDLTRSLDASLHTTQGPLGSFLILARYASRAVLDDDLAQIRKHRPARGSLLWPPNLLRYLLAWAHYGRYLTKLALYEGFTSFNKNLAFP